MNLGRSLILCVPMSVALLHSAALARDTLQPIKSCMTVTADDERLRCFDREVRKLAKPTFEGRLDVVTAPFTIDEPTTLRFHSDGVIFVLYVKTIDDQVVQNLHIGGGGESSYRIEKPGTYFLQVNGAEGWSIWLDPPPKTLPAHE